MLKLVSLLLFMLYRIFFNPLAHAESEYLYHDRKHTFKENAKTVGTVYLASWLAYPLFQLDTFKNEGSFDKYQKNFGKIIFDKDEPYWNWFVHSYVGSQLYLLYRSKGYSQMNSFYLCALSSALFELTVEVYTEPASLQDLYQTPILGSLLGLFFEKASLALLKSESSWSRAIGHVMNPWISKSEVKAHITPVTNFREMMGLRFVIYY